MTRAAVLLILGLTTCGKEPAPRTPLERLGLSETVLGRPMVEESMQAANAILGNQTGYRIAGSWQAPAGHPGQVTVPVYLVDKSVVPAVYSVMVPDACRCIFVQPDALLAWLASHPANSSGALDTSPSAALAFMLLHEIGHIAHGDPGQFESEGGKASFNLASTIQKDREFAADKFAVEQIDAASRDLKAFKGWQGAMAVSLWLTTESWNLQADRLLNHFGGTTLCSKALFADNGYTHPNLEFRVLMANDLLSHSEASHQLLEEFRSCQSRGPDRVLYKAR